MKNGVLKDSDDKTNLGPRIEKDVEALAAKFGLCAFFAEPDELFIDLDDGAKLNQSVLAAMEYHGISVLSMCETTSKSKLGTHVYLRLNMAFECNQRIAMQTALGSDPMREALTVVRLIKGQDEKSSIALFETENESYTVIGWRASA